MVFADDNNNNNKETFDINCMNEIVQQMKKIFLE